MPAYLNQGATSLAAANWSDTTGFADNAELVIVGTDQTDNNIVSNLDQSANTTGSGDGIHYLHTRPRFRGNVGTAAAPVITEFDTTYSTQAQVRHAGSGDLYIQGDTCALVEQIGAGATFLRSGTWTTVVVLAGSLDISSDAEFDNLYVFGGSVVVNDHASSDYDLIEHTGGTIQLRRGGATSSVYDIGGSARLFSNIEAGEHKTVRQHGGTIFPIRGNIAVYRGIAGTVDERIVERDLTIGSTSAVRSAALRIIEAGNSAGTITYSNVTDIGGAPNGFPNLSLNPSGV